MIKMDEILREDIEADALEGVVEGDEEIWKELFGESLILLKKYERMLIENGDKNGSLGI